MAFRIRHAFSSPKSDGGDATLVRPSNWNEDHTIEMNAGKVMGRDNSSAGNAQELPLSFSPDGDADFDTGTGGLGLPAGTTAQRLVTGLRDGVVRYNTTLSTLEGYVAGAWKQFLSSTITVLTTMSGAAFNESNRVDIASATTCSIGAATSNSVRITGSVDIDSFGNGTSGWRRHLYFAGALTLKHSSSLILPNNGDDIETAVGDTAMVIVDTANNWRVHTYTRANGQPVANRVRDYDDYTSSSTLTSHIPADNTIPQVGEGTEILSAAVVPSTTTSRVRVTAKIPIGAPSGVSGVACAALFRNGGANAIDANFVRLVDGFGNYNAVLQYEHVPGSTATQTYTVRVGGDTFNVLVNADIGGRLGGGVSRASLVVEVL